MLSFDFSNVDASVIGAEHGIDRQEANTQYGAQLSTIVETLYATKNQEGGWKKWLNLGYDEGLVECLQGYAQSAKGKYENLVILGIGGSSLGGFATLKALLHPYWNDLPAEKRNGFPRFFFVENVDADQIRGLLDVVDLDKTLFNVISKSGTTAETMSAFMLVKERLESLLGDKASDHMVVTTDRNKGILRNLANTHGYTAFEVPDDVGGRFSIFSAVGLLPAMLVGLDVPAMLQGIRDLDAQLQKTALGENPAAQGALYQYLAYEKGKPISVFMPYSYRLAAVSDWYVQLWAESLGKKTSLDGAVVHSGPTPLKAVGVTDQHSQIQLYNEGPFDKIITFVAVESPDANLTIPPLAGDDGQLAYLGNRTFGDLMAAEFQSTRASLTRNQRPNLTIAMPKVDAYHLAQLFYFLEVQTAIAGALFNIDPFDQPGVELAKKYTYALMGREGYDDLLPEARGEQLAQPIS